jgi:molybdopterin molybdotransferase
MISVAEAQSRIEAAAVATETVALSAAAGRTLAEDVRARRDQPPFAASMMDGYALRGADAGEALAIVGESAAGRPFDSAIGAGECVRISTGAPLPVGADCILAQEDARMNNNVLHLEARPSRGFIRARASDFAADDRLLMAGQRLDAPQILLAAAAGAARVCVRQRPRLGLFAMGDELVAPGSLPAPAQIYESASYGVAALAGAWGAEASPQKPLLDDPHSIAEALQSARDQSDALVIIGGASSGPHDHARSVFASLGLSMRFSGVALKPGKPTWFGYWRGRPILGLPGNPASALVSARLFLCPLIEQMLGRDGGDALVYSAGFISTPLGAGAGREEYVRAIASPRSDGFMGLTPACGQDSALTTSLAASNALIRRPADASAASAGAVAHFLSWFG